MIKKIYLFPLETTVVPNEQLPLHIFEDRYKRMIKECLRKKSVLGIVQKRESQICDIGCTVKIEEVLNRYQNGEYDILLKGVKRFKIISKTNYLGLWIAKISYLKDSDTLIDPGIVKTVHDKYLRTLIANKAIDNLENEIKKKKSYDFCQAIRLNSNFKQTFLELNDENERLLFLGDIFDKSLNPSSIMSRSNNESKLD